MLNTMDGIFEDIDRMKRIQQHWPEDCLNENIDAWIEHKGLHGADISVQVAMKLKYGNIENKEIFEEVLPT